MSKIFELKTRGIRPQLRQAMESRQLVRVWRQNLEPGSFAGFVCAVGPEFFVLWALGDYIGFDGFYALRHRDVTELETPDSNVNFLTKAMAWRNLEPVLPTDLPVDSVETLLAHLRDNERIVSVHLDSEGIPEACYVGRVLSFEADGLQLQEISPDAEWMTESSAFGFDEISALAWRTPYGEALNHIAGPPPDLQPAGFGRGNL